MTSITTPDILEWLVHIDGRITDWEANEPSRGSLPAYRACAAELRQLLADGVDTGQSALDFGGAV